MGYGSYSQEDRQVRSVSRGYATKSTKEIFAQEKVHNEMDAVDPLPSGDTGPKDCMVSYYSL